MSGYEKKEPHDLRVIGDSCVKNFFPTKMMCQPHISCWYSYDFSRNI